MNEKNLEYLKENLKYLGFGEKLNADLEKNIKQQPGEFKLNAVGEFGKDTSKQSVNYSLDFKKSDQSDMYFLNRYKATLTNNDPEKERSQTFYITKNTGVTAKEAFNLLNGRAVNAKMANKDGEKFKAWVQLDFQEKDKHDNYKTKQFHEKYGYDLESVLNRYPIRELQNAEEKDKLMKSLEKGNLQRVTFVVDGKEEKKFMEANPQYKTVNLYDQNMQKVFQGVDKKEKETERSQEKKESVRQDPDDDGPGKREKGKKRGVGI